MIEWIGLLAGALTSTSFFPQAIKVIRTKQLSSISLVMYINFTFGVALWIFYGFYLHSLSVFICNTITLIPASVILCLKVRETVQSKRMKRDSN
ncbi:SemiSWEET family sugar transporter [Sporolactobacillus spathodeae]|uniref:MtN3 and saliva related transmembrane protein n=1 Tax=Sporolactobacillus spathodeae TaxID=1465502 RepID=A0ABS2Q8N7_9BACL|nr:SemiSWEET transporter [Sporolactobacillus spathodeae]MBM7658148.1 MtN3 and saliva related transmembrane protein [Sporolactobacillus spathodeae]